MDNKIPTFFSSWFFIGFAPFAPGTFGAIAALPFCFLLSKLGMITSVVLLLLVTSLAIWVSDLTEKIEQKKDPSEIVIDEVVGMAFAMFALPFTANNIMVGFMLFRFIDIIKPQPIRFVDKNFTGGFGVVCDDILAGVTSNIIIRYFIVL